MPLTESGEPRALIGSLRTDGHAITYGRLGGEPINLPNLTLGNLHVDGFWITNWIRSASRDEITDTYRTVAGLVADGTLHTEVASTHDLADYRSAIAAATDPATTGKVY